MVSPCILNKRKNVETERCDFSILLPVTESPAYFLSKPAFILSPSPFLSMYPHRYPALHYGHRMHSPRPGRNEDRKSEAAFSLSPAGRQPPAMAACVPAFSVQSSPFPDFSGMEPSWKNTPDENFLFSNTFLNPRHSPFVSFRSINYTVTGNNPSLEQGPKGEDWRSVPAWTRVYF